MGERLGIARLFFLYLGMGIIRLFGKEVISWGNERDLVPMVRDVSSNILAPSTLEEKEVNKILKELATVVAPVTAMGRQTLPDNKSILEVIGEMMIVQPGFDLEWLDSLAYLAQFHPDISAAVDNISLANTPFTTYFDEKVPDSMQKEMLQYLTESRDTWYDHADGINGWIDDSLTQCAISGALSHEWLVNKRLDGINKVVMVNPKNILFRYDPDKSVYVPVQKIPSQYALGGSLVLGTYKKLNPITYRYHAMRRINEVPYAVPPFMAAMENIMIQRDMVSNIKTIIKKLGLLGFLKIMLNAPQRMQNETDDAYYARLKNIQTLNGGAMRDGLANSAMIGFKDMQEIEMQSTNNNVQGAADLMDMNDRLVMNGVKMPLEMMNRKNTTSETFGRVMLAKLGRSLDKYQRLVGMALSYADLMHLQLAGYPVMKVTNEFEPVMLGDKSKEEEAYGKKIENAGKLYDAGIISQMQRANMLGYDQPDQEEPRQSVADQKTLAEIDQVKTGGPDMPKKTSAENDRVDLDERFTGMFAGVEEHGLGYHLVDMVTTLGRYDNVIVTQGMYAWVPKKKNRKMKCEDVISITLKKKADLVQYLAHSLGAGKRVYWGYDHDHVHEEEAGKFKHVWDDPIRRRPVWADPNIEELGIPKDEEKWWSRYNRAADKAWKKTTKAIQEHIAKNLSVTASPGRVKANLHDFIMYSVYSQVEKVWKPEIDKIVQEHVNDIYNYYRKSKRPWAAVAAGKKDIPDAVFNLTDIRAMEFYKNSDQLYLGKFITDPDTNKRLTKFIKEKYLDDDTEIGNNEAAINEFADIVGRDVAGQCELEDWKIRRIIDTSVNRMRNTAAISYMNQAEVERFVVVGLSDRLQCDYCKTMNGKVMSVTVEMQKIERVISAAPEDTPDISPFITATGMKPSDLKEMSGEAIQDMGVGAPSYHGHCRCVVVVDL